MELKNSINEMNNVLALEIEKNRWKRTGKL